MCLLNFPTRPALLKVPACTCAKHAITCLVPSIAISFTYILVEWEKSEPASGYPTSASHILLQVQVQTRQWSQCCVFPGGIFPSTIVPAQLTTSIPLPSAQAISILEFQHAISQDVALFQRVTKLQISSFKCSVMHSTLSN